MFTSDRLKKLGLPAQADKIPEAEKLPEDLRDLFDEAAEKFGAMCLWNFEPVPTINGLAVIADRLQKNGGMPAWRLSEKISTAIKNATR